VFLDHKTLTQDDYVVIAELMDAERGRIPGGIWRDKFSKRYSGIPKVGIDENNAFRLNGKLFFPIGPFMTDLERIDDFINKAHINMLRTEGWYETHTPTTWNNYLDNAAKKNLVVIGPERGDYYGPAGFPFNSNVDRMTEYIQMSKDKPAMFAWIWKNETNLGGRHQQIYLPTLAAWAYVVHREDPQHPASNSFYGNDWTKHYGTGPTINDYIRSAPLFGGKKWLQDFLEFDIYTIAQRLHPSLNFPDMGPYAAYFDAMDRMRSNNKDLVPIEPSIAAGNLNRGETVLIHSSEQVYSKRG